jgi:hypothetical protein
MNEHTLKDLRQKVNNLLHDFELEHELHGLMAVSMDGNRLIIEAKEMTAEEETHLRASGGIVTARNNNISAGEAKELFIPNEGGVVVPNESIYPSTLLNDGDAAGISQAVEELRIKKATGALSESTLRGGYSYQDAPGMVFASPDEHAAWQRQQQKRARG